MKERKEGKRKEGKIKVWGKGTGKSEGMEIRKKYENGLNK